MSDRYLGRVISDMDVCDLAGDKIGTVARVYRYDLARVGGGGDASLDGEEVMEVKSGFLGLGKHWYIPLSAIDQLTSGCVFLSKTRADIEQTDWDQKPAYLDQLS